MPAAERLGAVVIGHGRMGAMHAEALVRHPRTELRGVADSDESRLRAFAGGLRSDTDAVALCSELQPDIVTLATPATTHASLALSILATSRPRVLVVEKPLATSAREAQAVVEAARDSGATICVNYTRRFLPAFRELATELRSGVLGRPRFALVVYGKGLANNGSHAIDLLRMFFGEPLSACGEPAPWATGGAGDDPTFAAELVFGKEFRARLQPFDESLATVFEFSFFTDQYRIDGSFGGRKMQLLKREQNAVAAGYTHYVPTSRTWDAPLGDGPQWLVRDVVEHLDADSDLACRGEDGVAALQWVETIRGRP